MSTEFVFLSSTMLASVAKMIRGQPHKRSRSAVSVKHFCVIIPGVNMAASLLLFTPAQSQAAPSDLQSFLFDRRSAPASPFQGGKKRRRNAHSCRA